MRLTLKKAIDISIKKWEYAVNNKGFTMGAAHAIPEIWAFKHSTCGLCEYRHQTRRRRTHDLCHNDSSSCPLFLLGGKGCNTKGSLYYNWRDNICVENAQKVLDKLKEVKDDYERRGYQIVKD